MTNNSWVKDGHLNLGEYVAKLLKEKGPHCEELKSLINIYGKDKLRECYDREKNRGLVKGSSNE